jgi:hypothetical protein
MHLPLFMCCFSWLHFLVCGQWDVSIATATQDHLMTALTIAYPTLTNMLVEPSATNGSSSTSLPIADSPASAEHDIFIKARGLGALSQVIVVVCTPHQFFFISS